MITLSDPQGDRGVPLCGEFLGARFNRCGVAGEHELTRGVVGPDLSAGRGDGIVQTIRRGGHGNHGTIVAERAHFFGANDQQGERVLEGKHARDTSSGVFPDAVPQHDIGFNTPTLPGARQAVAEAEQGDLTKLRLRDTVRIP